MRYLAKNHIPYASGVDFNFGGDWKEAHSHDYWEFVLITENCVQIINNQKVPLKKGQALIIRPNDKHKFSDSQKVISQCNIKITHKKMEELSSSYNNELFLSLLSTPNHITLELNHSEYNSVYQHFQNALFDTNRTKTELYLKMAIHTILHSFILNKYLYLGSTRQYSVTVQRIIEKISMWDNFSKPLTELLKDFNFSYMQLYRIFKKETGSNLNDYFLQSKMAYASTLLLTSSDSALSIAQTIGYATQSHFGKAFKDYFGCSPSTYRKNNATITPSLNTFSNEQSYLNVTQLDKNDINR